VPDRPSKPIIISAGVIDPTAEDIDCPDTPITSAGDIDPTDIVEDIPVGITIGLDVTTADPREDEID